jgi:dienelactone hydrolase
MSGLLELCLMTTLFTAPVLPPGREAFAPYLKDEAPQIVETLSVEQRDGVEVTRLKFLSRLDPVTGERSIIYGILARPLAPGKHPALLVCHGGSACADMVASQTEAWAQRGYVAFCQDEPGICDNTKALSTGPWITERRSDFTVRDGRADTSATFDGVVAALNGLALLRSRPDVDTSRVGVWGGSWGGYMTTMVTGLAGDRVTAAFAVYGCGFYELASTWRATLMRMSAEDRETWLATMDAGRHASGMRAPYFNCAAANDWFFWPEAVQKTLEQVSGYTNQVFSPNDSHQIRVPGGTAGPPKVDSKKNRTHMETVWFAHYLDGTEKPFPKLTAGEAKAAPGGIEVRWSAEAPVPLQRSWAVYAQGPLPARMRLWAPVEATDLGDGTFSAVIPVADPDVPLLWYGLATDERNVTVSTRIQTAEPKVLGVAATAVTPDRFGDDLESPLSRMRWARAYTDRLPGKASLTSEAARGEGAGIRLVGPVRYEMNGVSGEALGKSGAPGIFLWVRNANAKTAAGLDVLLVGEDVDGRRVEFSSPRAKATVIGPQWQRLEVLFSDLKYKGVGEPPIQMLSSRVGQVRLDAADGVQVDVDDLGLL